MMDSNGWIRLPRKMLENDFLLRDSSAFIVFTRLLLTVKRDGSRTIGRQQLAELTGLKPMTAYKALLRLKNQEMVEIASNNRYTVVCICNWNIYQDNETGQTSSLQSQQHPKRHFGNSFDNNLITDKREEEREKSTATNVAVGLWPIAAHSHAGIDEAFKYWTKRTGIPISGLQDRNRQAARNLLRRYDLSQVKKLIDGVAIAQGERYAPKIADFCELEEKLSRLLVWGTKNGMKSRIGVVR